MPEKKLSSRDIEARMEKLRRDILALDRVLAKQGADAVLSFDCRRFEVVKLNRTTATADVAIWLGSGLK